MKRPSFSRYGLPLLAVVGVVFALWVALRGQPDRSVTQPAVTPATAPASRGGTVSGAGLVEPSSELIEVGALVPGVVTRVLVTPGERVTAGQPLFTVDDRDARARVTEARATVDFAERSIASAQADLDAAQAQLALLEGVEDPRAVSRQQLIERRAAREQAAARLAVARADRERSQAALQTAETELTRRTVRAPRSAEVLQVRTRPGQYATAGPAPGGNGEPLMTLGETRPLHVRIDVDEQEIERVAMGRPGVISPRGDARQRLTVRFVRAEPLVIPKRSLTNQATERVDVRVLQLIYALPVDAEGFFVGQQVDAFLPAKDGR